MMQGDAYLLGIQILNNAGMPVTPADVIDVELTIGHMKKRYSEASLSYSDGLWLFPLNQSETFGCLPAAPKETQAPKNSAAPDATELPLPTIPQLPVATPKPKYTMDPHPAFTLPPDYAAV